MGVTPFTPISTSISMAASSLPSEWKRIGRPACSIGANIRS